MKYLALLFLLTACAGHSEFEDMGYKEVYNHCDALILEDANGAEVIEIRCQKDPHSSHPVGISNP